MRPHCLIAYRANHSIAGTLSALVTRDTNGNVTGLADFAAHEAAGGDLGEFYTVSGAAGYGTWPEFLGTRVHEFTVELDAEKRITALVHGRPDKPGFGSGHRRERAAIEAAIEAEPEVTGLLGGLPAKDIRHIVGGPSRPLLLDADGKTLPPGTGGTPKHLPVIRGNPDRTPVRSLP